MPRDLLLRAQGHALLGRAEDALVELIGDLRKAKAARVLGEAIDFSRQGQLSLRDVQAKEPPAVARRP